MQMETSPAYPKTMNSLADRFYEMHAICEMELSLNLKQKHMVSLGYLLYSSPDGFMIGSHLRNIDPDMYKELHKTMVLVGRTAMWTVTQRGIQLSAETLNDYLEVITALESRLYQLKRATEQS